jgi:hypothetical protein
MKIYKYFYYVYLIMAIFFLYDAYVRITENQNSILSFLFAALAIFMFFFRRHFSNKIQNNSK